VLRIGGFTLDAVNLDEESHGCTPFRFTASCTVSPEQRAREHLPSSRGCSLQPRADALLSYEFRICCVNPENFLSARLAMPQKTRLLA
jgi:hypothetical protein